MPLPRVSVASAPNWKLFAWLYSKLLVHHIYVLKIGFGPTKLKLQEIDLFQSLTVLKLIPKLDIKSLSCAKVHFNDLETQVSNLQVSKPQKSKGATDTRVSGTGTEKVIFLHGCVPHDVYILNMSLHPKMSS